MGMQLYGPTRVSEANESFGVFDFRGGLNIKSLPQEMADNELSAALNVLLRADGGVEMRKGMTVRGTALGGANVGKNLRRFFQTVVNGVALASPNRVLVAQIGDTLYNYDAGTQIGATGALGTSSQPMSCVQVYDADHVLAAPASAPTLTAVAGTSDGAIKYVATTYVNANGETTLSPVSSLTPTNAQQVQVASPPAYGNATGYNTYESATGAAGTFYKQNAAPTAIGSTFTIPNPVLTATLAPTTNTALAPSDVLVICTGVGGPYVYDGAILYTPSAYSAVAGARWVSKINGMVYFGGIPSQGTLVARTLVGNHVEQPYTYYNLTGWVTGLAPLGAGATGGMCVGHTSGLTVLYGAGPSTDYDLDFVVPDYPDAGRAMLVVEGAIVFLGSTAVWRFDGQQVTRLSDKVEPWILNDPLNQDFAMNGSRTLSFAWVYNNRLHLAYDSGNVGYCTAYLVLDLIVGGWTVFFGPKLAGAALLDAPGDSDPHLCVVIDATKGQVYNWDQYAGTGTNGHGVSDAGAAITANFTTKYFKIEEPGCPKKLVTLYPEMFVESFTGQIVATADYGNTPYSLTATQTSNAMVWDSSSWDAANWGSSGPAFFKPRLEISNTSPLAATSLEGEAFAFGVANNSSDPPFRFAGITGEIVYLPRS